MGSDLESHWRAIHDQDEETQRRLVEMEEARRLAAKEAGEPSAMIMFNDPEPGYRAPEYLTDDKYVVSVSGSEEALNRLEEALRDAGMTPHRLGDRDK